MNRMRKKKNLWSGVSILIVAVLVITAFIRGNAQAWLLAAAFVIWAVCRILPELGKLLRSVPENNFQRAEQLIVAYRYLAYDFDQPFLPQYRDNMLFLKAMLEKLA